MICQKCNTENPENALFCKGCGASLMNQQPEQQPEQQAKEENTYTPNPVIGLIKKIASSQIFLAGAILYTVYAFLGLISSVSISSFTNSFIQAMEMAEMPLEEIQSVAEMLSGLTGPLTAVSLVCMIPTVLIAVAVWLIYNAGKDKTVEAMKTTGIAIIKVITIIQLVLLCVGCGLGIVACLLLAVLLPTMSGGLDGGFSSMSYDYGYSGDITTEMGIGIMMVLCVICIIFLLITLAVGLVFNISALKTINGIKVSAETDKPFKKISMFLIVMMFISAASNILSFSISGICLGAAYILFAIALLDLRREMAELPEPETLNSL